MVIETLKKLAKTLSEHEQTAVRAMLSAAEEGDVEAMLRYAGRVNAFKIAELELSNLVEKAKNHDKGWEEDDGEFTSVVDVDQR